jgi:nicotinate dehydrogenase subunit A
MRWTRKPILLRVNGATHQVRCQEDTPLLYVLRNDLGLNGPKFGCGLGQCGACTVIIKEAAVRSCSVPVGSVGTGEVTTLEGLSRNGELHPQRPIGLHCFDLIGEELGNGNDESGGDS